MKKKITLLLSLLTILFFAQENKVGINTTDPKAVLDIQSTTSGVLLPRLTNAQVNAIANPPLGLMVFNTDYNCLMVNYSAAASPTWKCMSGTVQNTNNAAYTAGFPKNYGGSNGDQGVLVFNNSDGNLVVFSNTNSIDYDVSQTQNQDMWITTINMQGAIISQKLIGGTNDDKLNWVLKVPDGYLVLGDTTSLNLPGFAGKSGAFYMKLDNALNLQWTKPAFYSVDFGGINFFGYLVPYVETDGSIVFINKCSNVSTVITSDNPDPANLTNIIFKTDSQLNIVQKKYFSTTGQMPPYGFVTKSTDGNYLIPLAGLYARGVVKVSLSNATLWSVLINNSGTLFSPVLDTGTGNYYYKLGSDLFVMDANTGAFTSSPSSLPVGAALFNSETPNNFYLLANSKIAKIGSTMNTIWEKSLSGWVSLSLVEKNGFVYVTGNFSGQTGDLNPPLMGYGQADVVVVKMDAATGNIVQ